MDNRRTFIKKAGLLTAVSIMPSCNLILPKKKEKLGVALVGLGYYSRDLLAPALQLTKHCELKGIVTGSPEKIPIWQQKYGIAAKNVYNYQNMHEIANNDEIDIVYIVLPNGLHKKYTIIGANAGKHVWCEKPMAMNVLECQQMITACAKNKVQLTIGYRMQHEPVTQQIIKWRSSKPYGMIQSLYAEAGFFSNPRDPKNWRLHKELGGGAMFDMGVYTLNASRYVTGLEPVAVTAKQYSERSAFIADETTIFDLEFPNDISATCKTTFAANINTLKVDCENGWYQLSPMQSYSGVRGTTSDGKTLSPFQGNQQAKQMDDNALAILNKKSPLVPGEEGMKDIKVVEAIFKSAANKSERILF